MYFLISGGADTLSVFIMDYVVGSTKSIGIIPPVARGNYTVIDISLGPAFLAGNGSALKLEPLYPRLQIRRRPSGIT